MDTATGLLAVIPVFPENNSESPAVLKSLELAENSPEINKTVVVNVNQNASFYSTILETIKAAEKKEGEKYRLVLVLNPQFNLFTTDNIMECFQRLIIDALSDGLVAVTESERGKTWDVDKEGYLSGMDLRMPLPLVLWKRDVFDQGITSTQELRVLPYPV